MQRARCFVFAGVCLLHTADQTLAVLYGNIVLFCYEPLHCATPPGHNANSPGGDTLRWNLSRLASVTHVKTSPPPLLKYMFLTP